jgi:hypothetical protein
MQSGRRNAEMGLELDVSGVKIELEISGYKPVQDSTWYSEWCRCNFRFSSGDWLNYHKENEEVLLCCEVDKLAEILTDFIENKFLEDKEISFAEPDFIFRLYAEVRHKNQQEVEALSNSIDLEWRVYFWEEQGGANYLTANYISLLLGQDDIVSLRDYLVSVQNDKA